MRALLFLLVVESALVGCSTSTAVSTETAQRRVQSAWQASYHTIWEIDWPNAPISGPATIEVWQMGDRYRYEILETPAPSLLGETLVSDGTQTWRYNRLAPSASPESATPALAPITDAVMIISNLLSRHPTEATAQADSVNLIPATKILMLYTVVDFLLQLLNLFLML